MRSVLKKEPLREMATRRTRRVWVLCIPSIDPRCRAVSVRATVHGGSCCSAPIAALKTHPVTGLAGYQPKLRSGFAGIALNFDQELGSEGLIGFFGVGVGDEVLALGARMAVVF